MGKKAKLVDILKMALLLEERGFNFTRISPPWPDGGKANG